MVRVVCRNWFFRPTKNRRSIPGTLGEKPGALDAERRLASHKRTKAVRSVLFMCFGNINRSPVAEFHLKIAYPRPAVPCAWSPPVSIPRRIAPLVWCRWMSPANSASTCPRTRLCAVTEEMLDAFDVIIAMDHTHLKSLKEINPGVLHAHYYRPPSTKSTTRPTFRIRMANAARSFTGSMCEFFVVWTVCPMS